MEFNITALGIIEELRFMLELIGGELLFTLPCCKRRNNFKMRLIIGIIVLTACSFLYFPYQAFISYLAIKNVFLMSFLYIVYYIFLTILTIAFLLVCFDFSLDQAIFHATGGYCIQHICYVLFTELLARTWAVSISDHLFSYVMISLIGFSLVCIGTYYASVRKFKDIDYVYFLGHRKSLLYYTVILIITIFLTFAGQSIYQNNATTREVSNPNYLGAAVSLLTTFLIILCIHMLYVDNQKSREKELVTQLMHEQEKEFAYKQEVMETVKHLAHDIKHQMLMLDNNSEAAEKIKQEINDYDALINTNNEALNIILMDKIISTKKDNIKIEFDGDGSLLDFMDKVDLSVLFGNALDNAVEAIKKSDSQDNIISITLKRVKNVISLNISNYYDGNLKTEKGVIKTSKENSVFHGIGLKSIKQIIEKYNGNLYIDTKNNIFTVKALFIK